MKNKKMRVELEENYQNDSGILTPKQVPPKYPAFTDGAVRSLIFNGEKNGFDKCIRRVGRKILIIETLFLDWINSQNGGKHVN